jgi:uncharacterized protein (DUF1501 family)
MTAHSIGCQEYHELSRRRFLAASAATAAAGAALASPAWLPRIALAKSHRSATRDVVIAIFLRGGFDGLSAVVPYENAYVTARPNTFVPRHDDLARPMNERCIFLDSPSNGVSFGLNPNLSGLMTPYSEGKLLFIHASGSTDTSRSHFDAEKYMEAGQPLSVLNSFSGWLGRHLLSVAPMNEAALLRAVGIAGGLQKSLIGAPLALPVPNLASFGLEGPSSTRNAREAVLYDLYGSITDPLKTIGQSTLNTIDLLQAVGASTYAPTLPAGVAYPTNSFGTALRNTAALLKAQVGVEAVAIDTGGWDLHTSLGAVTVNGTGPTTMQDLMRNLGNALQAFYVDMQAAPSVTYTAVAMSEFGRRLAQNANLGVDHGWGDTMMVMGSAVNGGRVMANWPGLGPGQLFQNVDLKVTIDYRDILAEIIQDRLGNGASLAQIFPGYTPINRGAIL